MTNVFKRLINKLLDAIYPKRVKCIICGDELNTDERNAICPHCYERLPFISDKACIRCDMPLAEDDYSQTCFNCKRHNYRYTAVRSVFRYEGNIRACIYKFKYKHQEFLGEYFSEFLVRRFARLDWNIDYVLPVPLHTARLKSRGYNQSYVMAKPFCDKLGLEILDNVTRIKDTPSQTNLGHKERAENVKDAFAIADKSVVKGKNILIIDDVYTTGATIEALTELMLDCGANAVYGLTLAHAIMDKDL